MLEQQFGEELFLDANTDDFGSTEIKLERLYKCGIVQCEDRAYMKDSIDVVGVTRIGRRNQLHVVGMEVKSRLSCATA